MKEFWDQRYSAREYAYGIEPNEFFRNQLIKLELKGKILLPGEGEGRNGVYAAKKGLEVLAVDQSEAGRNKALALAQRENVHIQYQVGDFSRMDFGNKIFDVAAMIFVHFPPDIVSACHRKIIDMVRPGGYIILEGFSKNNLKLREENPKVGGPGDINMLYSVEEIRESFPDFDIIQLEEKQVDLGEGQFHVGLASVVRFVGRKKSSM